MDRYYHILGISAGASKEEIKRAYRKQAKLYHPDINPSAEAKKMFILVDEAYDILYNNKRVTPKTSSQKANYSNSTYSKNPNSHSNNKNTAYQRWEHIFRAPKNPTHYKEWLEVKQQQEREGKIRRKSKPDSNVYKRWEFVFEAPENPIQYEEWKKVKLQQEREGKAKRKSKLTESELKLRNSIKNGGFYGGFITMYFLLNFFSYVIMIFSAFITIFTLYDEVFFAIVSAIICIVFYQVQKKLSFWFLKYLN